MYNSLNHCFISRSKILLFLLVFFAASELKAQGLLQKKISIQAKNKTIAEVFKIAEKQGGFYFSYNNNIIKTDSLVSISLKDKTIEMLLTMLFDKRYQYQERNNHIIIQPAIALQHWYVSGQIIDKNTGEPVAYATVYERNQLVSTMSDVQGYFRLQLKERQSHTNISISKVSYADTLVIIPITNNAAPLTVGIEQISYTLDSVTISGVEKTFLAGLLLSSKQTMNSLNLNSFFSKQPFQFSLVPGLGSHGRMGAQVVNKFSLNVIGGYTAGVNGIEIGSVFNIVKQDMKHLQIGGLFNIVGGQMNGLQIGGLHNTVLDSVSGIQIAGLSNFITKHVSGIQVGGVYNQTASVKGIQVGGAGNINRGDASGVQVAGLGSRNKRFNGIQVAGALNLNTESVNGIQVAGLANIDIAEAKGLQIAGLLNVTKMLKGVQIGLVNFADSSDGYSIGLININPKGYHKLSVSTSELQHLTIGYKSGNSKLYSIMQVGTQLNSKEKAYSVGYGIGSDKSIGKRFFLNPELTQNYFYTGNSKSQHLLTRLQFNIKYKLATFCYIYTGPAFSLLYSNNETAADGYRSNFINDYPSVAFSNRIKGWLGWNIGLDLF